MVKVVNNSTMRISSLISLIATIMILASCASNSEEPEIDCSQSDISVSLISGTVAGCQVGGSIEFGGTGGTTPYMFSIDGSTFQSSSTFSGLSAGTYTATIEDSNGCLATVETEINAGPDGIKLNLVTTNSECDSAVGAISATATGGDGDYTFSLDGDIGVTTGQFNDVARGIHSVMVSDGTGCSSTKGVAVKTNVLWMSQIMPIFETNCNIVGCHNGNDETIPNFTIFSSVQAFRIAIKTNTVDGSMPRAGSGLTLLDAEIELIACWVDDGAPNN